MTTLRQWVSKAFNSGRAKIGEIAGSVVHIYRPNYNLMTLVTGEEGAGLGESSNIGPIHNEGQMTIVQGEVFIKKLMVYREPWGPKFGEPGMVNADYYSVFCDLTGLEFGDILIDPTGVNPTLTLTNFYDTKEIVAIRSDRIGAIYDDLDTPIIPGLRYEFEKFADTLRSVNPLAPEKPLRRVILFERFELMPHNFTVSGKRLVETDGILNPPKRWIITLIEHISPIIVLTLEEEE